MDDDYSGHRVINKTIRTACIPASYPSSPQKPIMDWDWRFGLKDLACGSELSFARPSAATTTFPGANVKTVASNVPRFESNGMPLEGSATNKCTCAKSNPQDPTNISKTGDAAAVLSVVNDATALADAGMGEFGPNVYKLDNSAGTGLAYAVCVGACGNTNAHSISAYIRGGGGRIKLNGSNTTATVWTAKAAYTRIALQNVVPSSTGDTWLLSAVAGSIVYFTLPQLEEGPVCTSPIPGGTGAITRASEGSDTSNNGLTMPLTQGMIDSLTGELLDGSTAWTHASGTAPAYSGGNRILTYSGALTSSDYHALSTTLSTDKQVEVVYTISGYAAGSIALGFGTAAGATRNANGTYTERGTLTANTNFYVNATGFTGVINIISIRRVLDSGQTNPGEGTVLCGVYLPWGSNLVTDNSTISIATTTSSRGGIAYLLKTPAGDLGNIAYDGVSAASLYTSNWPGGYYVFVRQFSARTSQMRVGLYNPATGALTWGNWTAYRGFFPITSTGEQRMRFFYGGGNLSINLTSTQWFNCILTDDDMLFYIKKFGCAL